MGQAYQYISTFFFLGAFISICGIGFFRTYRGWTIYGCSWRLPLYWCEMTYTCCRFPLSVAESAWREALKTPQWEQMVEAMKKDHEADKARRKRKDGVVDQQPAATDHVVIPMVETLPGGHIQFSSPTAPIAPTLASTPYRREDNADGAASAPSPIEYQPSSGGSYKALIAQVQAEIRNLHREERTYRACMGGMAITVDGQKYLDKLHQQIRELEMRLQTYETLTASPVQDHQATLQRQATAIPWDSPAPSPEAPRASGYLVPRRGSIRLPLEQLDTEASRYLTPRGSPDRPATPPPPPPVPPTRSSSVGHYSVPKNNRHV